MNHLPNLKDNAYDLGLIDVQFGIGEDGRVKRPTRVKQKNGSYLQVKQTTDTDEIWDNKQPEQSYFDELFRVTKYQIIWGCNYLQFNQKNTSSGRIVWDKVNAGSNQSDCEIAWTNLFSSIRQIEFMWNGMMQGRSLKQGRVQQGNKSLNEPKLQTCQKPVKLYQWLLQLPQVKKDWTILDTHVGSASSLVACEIEGFEYIGFEKLDSHFSKSNKRLLKHIKNYQPIEKKQFEALEQTSLF